MAGRAKKLSFHAKKVKACRKRELRKDRISELPDEIIVYVLSLLTMKEAGQTSVLSRRWRFIWAYIPVLNFDTSNALNKLSVSKLSDKLLEVERPRCLSWVNQIVGSHRGPTIDEFRVRFDLSATSSYSIDNWVQFVMEKRVKRLQLDFSCYNAGKQNNCYTFRGLSSCNSLTSLQLVSVNVTGEVLQSFLKSCPNLEYLSVKGSESLVSLEVDRETPNLKYLEICLCFEIKHIQICAPNLVSFEYFGPEINMPFERTPKLVKLSVGGKFGRYLTNNFSEFSSYLCRLEALTLKLSLGIKFAMKSVDQFPLCTRLVHLELEVGPLAYEDLFCFAKMIKACPFLHKFVLKLYWPGLRIRRERLDVKACLHYHLKIVEVVGFLGNSIDLEFITYLMESCVALEKIVVNPCNPFFIGTPFEFNVNERKTTARKQAQQLWTKLKLGADLIIL